MSEEVNDSSTESPVDLDKAFQEAFDKGISEIESNGSTTEETVEKEEIVQESPEVPKEQVTSEDKAAEPEMSEAEKKAREKGWRPESEFDNKDGKEFVSAEEFLRRQPYFDALSKQNKQITALQKKLDKLDAENELLKAQGIKAFISALYFSISPLDAAASASAKALIP